MDPLAQAILSGAQAFPGVEVEPAAFARYLERLAPGAVQSADLFLAFACGRADPRALTYFDQQFLSKIPAAVAAVDPSRAFADEVIQTLRTRMLAGPQPQITTYRGSGSLLGWVLVTASRLAIDLFRERRKWVSLSQSEDAVLESLAAPDDPELNLLRERHGAALRDAIRAAFESINSRERAVLKLHVIDHAGIDEVARLYGIHRATAARWIQAIKATLRERTRARLSTVLALDGSEATSLIRTLMSEADVSLQRHLET